MKYAVSKNLEQRAVERTAQLESVNEELETFSYSVSHDLRAPLRQVMGFVELLQQDAGPSLSGKSLRPLTTTSQSAKRMGNLIATGWSFLREHFLTSLFPRADGGQAEYEARPIAD